MALYPPHTKLISLEGPNLEGVIVAADAIVAIIENRSSTGYTYILANAQEVVNHSGDYAAEVADIQSAWDDYIANPSLAPVQTKPSL